MRLFNLATVMASAAILSLSPVSYAQDPHNHQHAEHKSDDAHGHDEHHHTAPHGGALIVLGDEHAAHLELILEPATGKLTGYVLDGEAEKAIRVSQAEINLTLWGGDLKSSASVALKPVTSPLTGEKAGDSSQFEATVPALNGVKKFDLTVEGLTVRGIEYKKTKATYPEGNH